MRNTASKLKIRLYFSSAITFLVGISSSIAIYLTAQDAPESVFYEYEHSKRFRHDMEVAGGKLNMLASEMYKEFIGLFEGRTLAYTVAIITIIVCIALIYIANIDNQNKTERA
jgi:hypothetical protein